MERFRLIIDGMKTALATRYISEIPEFKAAPGPLLILVATWLSRQFALVARWAAQVEAGTVPAARRPAPSRAPLPASETAPAEAQAVAPDAVAKPEYRLPSGRAWLVRLSPLIGVRRSQLEYLLADPEMQSLVQGSPAIARVMRTLCRALLIDLSLLPPAPPRARGAVAPEPAAAVTLVTESSERSPLLPTSSRKGRRRGVPIKAYLNGQRSRPPPLVPRRPGS